MEWKDLAPWIAIAVTLILSILVPLFTQIANNKHQRKMQKEKLEYDEKQKKVKALEKNIYQKKILLSFLTFNKIIKTKSVGFVNQRFLFLLFYLHDTSTRTRLVTAFIRSIISSTKRIHILNFILSMTNKNGHILFLCFSNSCITIITATN